MIYLWTTALIWAFSFSLVGNALAGVDVYFAAWARMTLALGLFGALCRPKGVTAGVAARLGAIGAVQYGLMFLCYLQAFQTLKAYEVALFTITTPFWVVLFSGGGGGRLRPVFWLCAVLSIAGAWLLRAGHAQSGHFLKGFLWVQAADMCFAWGQTAYKRLRQKHPSLIDRQIYAFVYLGAFICTLGLLLLLGSWREGLELSAKQWGVLAWLGIVSSGVGLFFWNKGAVRTNPGSLAAANNLKIPLTIAVSWILFSEMPEGLGAWRFAAGAALILGAVLLPFFQRGRTGTPPGKR